MCLGNGTSQCTLKMRLPNVPWEWDYTMCPENETSQCSMGMGQDYVLYELD